MARRSPNNPVKLRAEARAAELGKSMAQVCREADVNRHYLAEMPKSESRDQVKLGRIAAALNWSIADLLDVETKPGMVVVPHHGERVVYVDPFAGDPQRHQRHFTIAIETAVRLMNRASAPNQPPPRDTSELAWRLYDLLERLGDIPEERALDIIGDQLWEAYRHVPET